MAVSSRNLARAALPGPRNRRGETRAADGAQFTGIELTVALDQFVFVVEGLLPDPRCRNADPRTLQAHSGSVEVARFLSPPGTG